jgi:hypothetical protein
MRIEKLKTEKDVRKFFLYLLNVKGLNFHPDTPFDDYIHINTKGQNPFFTQEEASRLDLMMEKAFLICEYDGLDIYEIALDVFTKFNNN